MVILYGNLKIAVPFFDLDALVLYGGVARSNEAEKGDRFHIPRLDAVAQMGWAAMQKVEQAISELNGHGGRLHLSADAHKHRIVELHAQTPQRVAHGRWGNMKLLGSTRDADTLHQRLECREAVEIKLM